MASITIKNIPPELHRELKELAKRSGRSLTQEIVQRLRTQVEAALREDAMAGEMETLHRLDEHLRARGFRTSAAEVERLIQEGRGE